MRYAILLAVALVVGASGCFSDSSWQEYNGGRGESYDNWKTRQNWHRPTGRGPWQKPSPYTAEAWQRAQYPVAK